MDNIRPNKSTQTGSTQHDANKENVPNLGKPLPLASETLNHPDDTLIPKTSLFQHGVKQVPADPSGPHVSESVKENSPLTSEEQTKLRNLVGVDALEHETPETLLFNAIKEGNLEAVRLLIKFGANINATDKTGNTPLHKAAEAGQADIVKHLSEQPGIELNKTNRLLQTPLHKAAAKGQTEAVNVLLSHDGIGPSLNAKDKLRGATPLHLAAMGGYTETLACFIEAHNKGAQIDFNQTNKNSETALTLAISKDQTEACLALIESGKVDPNIPNENGYTALHKAVTQNNPAIAAALLNGPIPVDVNQATAGGSTPLHLAATAGNSAMVQFLANEGQADINAVDLSQGTPLHNAAENGHAEVIQALIQTGSAEVNAVNKAGNTPLHLAAASGHGDATQALLAAKDIQACIVNTDGMSPLAFAEMNGRKDVAEQIKSASDPKREQLIHETKLMGHRFNLSGIEKERTPDYQLEGYSHYYTNRELATHWNEIIDMPFAEGFWADHQAELKEHFIPLNKAWSDTRTFDGEKVAQAIAEGTPCSIPGSYPGHYISMSISGDVLCINNRGFQSQEGGDIDETTLGLRFINIREYKGLFTETFVNRLQRGDVNALRQLYRLPALHEHTRTPQKRGNCTLAQAKADYQAHLIYFVADKKGINLTQATSEEWKEITDEVDLLYSDFVLYDRTQGLERYETLEANEPYHEAILKEGRNEMTRLTAKQNGHYNIIQGGGPILHQED